VSYSLDVDPAAQGQIAALPSWALPALAEAFSVLRLVPWNGHSANPNNPDGAVRMLPFLGPGLITYPILEDRRRVDILMISWAG
jgi:hypothetical protein